MGFCTSAVGLRPVQLQDPLDEPPGLRRRSAKAMEHRRPRIADVLLASPYRWAETVPGCLRRGPSGAASAPCLGLRPRRAETLPELPHCL